MTDIPGVLCYVSDNFAYFTTQPLDKQWGDDWNDAPYEHNAGRPYEWDERRGCPEYTITAVAFKSRMETPAEIDGMNSPYSVQAINNGAAVWLFDRWGSGVSIPAGATFAEFAKVIREAEGEVYVRAQDE